MSEEKGKKLSRRKFLKDASLIVAGGLTAGVIAGCAPTPVEAEPTCPPTPTCPTAEPCPTPAPLTILPEKWDKEADVVITGFGGAGAAAAIEAARAGAKVLLLERMKAGGGSTAICGGLIYMGGGTPVQKACGFEDTRDDMYNYLMAAIGEGADPEKIGVFCDKSLELYDWLTDLGLNFKQTYLPGKYPTCPTDDGLVYTGNESLAEFKPIALDVPRGHHAPAPGSSGAEIFKPLQAGVEAAGVEVMYETLAKRLVVDLDGRVCGVVADVNGTEMVIKASRAVVLTAGTYHANPDMVRQYAPAWLAKEGYTGTAGDDGSGIRMGQAVGADLDHIGTVTGFGGVYMFSEELVKGILVNDAGRRYIGEDGYGSRVGVRIVERFPKSFIVVDSTVWDAVPEKVREMLVPMSVQANTVTELAAAAGIPAVTLEGTLRDYNAMVAAGEDIEFQKDPHYLVPLTKGPFYAIAWGNQMVARQALGGLKVNVDTQVLDTNGAAIPGLYSAGANTAGIISRYYPASGTAVAQALIFGRIAGVKAAAE
ncbi:MAG TPA: FAD-dependent oxidoreductase, partial [Anaerolineaceae bacterium]|nr:FAD-dependent oxidoreductase [Anaerolineaceae bacterium]